MRATRCFFLSTFVLLALGCQSSDSQPTPDGSPSSADGSGGGHDGSVSTAALDALIEAKLAEAGAPGMGVAIVRDGEVILAKGYGLAHVEEQRAVTGDTMFLIASISKTIVSVAVMQLVEDGLLSLDADVNDVLGFSVRNPAAPSTPITLRQLLTHTSSLRDDWDTLDATVVQGDSPIALGDFLEGYFTPGGDFYDAAENFESWGPGQRYEYANVGVDLAGLIVERVTGASFPDRCGATIFTPLGMSNTSWRLAGLDLSTVAMPYERQGTNQVPYGHYGYPAYPSGLLRTSPRDLGVFLAAFAEGGAYHGTRVLEEATVASMREPQVPSIEPTQGIVWYWEGDLLGHDGGDPGVATKMAYRPSDGTGALVLTNGDWNESGAIEELVTALIEQAEDL